MQHFPKFSDRKIFHLLMVSFNGVTHDFSFNGVTHSFNGSFNGVVLMVSLMILVSL